MAGGSGQEKTEKATPKKKADARKKGQVAKSADLNGAVVLAAGLAALALSGPAMAGAMRDVLVSALSAAGDAHDLGGPGIAALMLSAGQSAALALAPVLGACLIAGLVVNVAQVGMKASGHGLKPDPKRLNPLQGAKNIFGPKGLFEGAKAVVKVVAVGAVVAVAVLPSLDQLAGVVGMAPGALASRIASEVQGIFLRGTAAYLAIAFVDVGYQRWRLAKSLRMDKQEVRDEHKQQNTPAEVKAAQRRRAMHASRARMMAAVPQADVVVTNPTHYAVALRYDAEKAAPEVVAKGADLVARKIRELAAAHGVPVLSEPPLARALHAGVEVGHVIPEELYQAVARVLAFVYRLSARRAA